MEIRPIPLPLRVPGKPGGRGFSRCLAIGREGFEGLWRALRAGARRRAKSLVLVESSALGDRRFISVVQFERQRFLIGSSPSSVTLLAQLPNAGANAAGGGAPSADEGVQ